MKIQWFHYENEGYYLSVKNLNEPIESLNPLYLRITHFNQNIDKSSVYFRSLSTIFRYWASSGMYLFHLKRNSYERDKSQSKENGF